MRSRLLVAVLIAAGVAAAGLAGLQRWQKAREAERVESLRVRLATRAGSPEEHHWLGLRLAAQGEKDEALGHLEIAARTAPSDLRIGNDLRLTCIRMREWDRCIAFFESLSAEASQVAEPHLQLALAYVDKMPDNMLGIVGQGRLSKLSIAQLNPLIALEDLPPETRWSALYALGLNHLYWPKALGHAPAAVVAFEAGIAHQLSDFDAARPCFRLPYLGLGDALVKLGRHDEARSVWREARMLLGRDARLDERLEITEDGRLTEHIDTIRGLGIAVDTDLSILWGRDP